MGKKFRAIREIPGGKQRAFHFILSKGEQIYEGAMVHIYQNISEELP